MSRIRLSNRFVALVLFAPLFLSAPGIADGPAITLETPPGCASSSPLPVIAYVTGDAPIDSLTWEVGQGGTPMASGTACTTCGIDPTRIFDAPLGECDNTVTVTAVDSLGRIATASRIVRLDAEGPVLRTDWPWNVVGCRDFTVEVPVPRTETGGRIHDPTTVPAFEYAVDQCDGWTHATCDDTGPYPVGAVTRVTCAADYAWGDQDQCGNPTQCIFEVDVRRPPHPGCYTHTFWDEDEFNTQPETRGWTRTAIGASEIHSAHLSEHGLWFAAKGPSLHASPGDDLAFLHRPPGASSFRVELPEPDLVAYGNNAWYWASGPMVRWGLDPEDPAVFVSRRPVPPLGFAFHSVSATPTRNRSSRREASSSSPPTAPPRSTVPTTPAISSAKWRETSVSRPRSTARR